MTGETTGVRTPTPSADDGHPDGEWSHTAAESRLLRALVAVSFGILAGMALAAGVAAVAFTAATLLAGEYGIAAALAFALALAAARSAPHLAACRGRDATGSAPLYEAVRSLGRSRLAGAVLFGLVVLWTGVQLGGRGFSVVAFGGIAVPMVVVSALTSEGELDADAETLTYCGTDVDLPALDGYRRVALGNLVFYRFSYVAGAVTPTTPRFAVVPAGVDGAVRDAVEAGVATESGEYDPPNRAVQATLVAFGVGSLAFAGALLTVEPTSSNPRGGAVLAYAALLVGLFGVIFLSLAARSG